MPATCESQQTHVVTGAFGYSGRYLSRRLLAAGHAVRTLTGRAGPDPEFGARIPARPLDFSDPAALRAHLEGTQVLYNTYWVRFAYGGLGHDQAVENTRVLFRAARAAGVERIVHVSICKAERAPWLPYYQGKDRLEQDLQGLGVSHAIVRPTVLFGPEDILINNIAWLLRRFPLFAVAAGDYGIQPVYVDDLAALMVRLGGERQDVTVDAVGPERFGFAQLVRLIAEALGLRRGIVPLPNALLAAVATAFGWVLGDRLLTRDEIEGLTANLLVSEGDPTCPTAFSAWLREHATELGRTYHNELERHFRRDRTPPPTAPQGRFGC